MKREKRVPLSTALVMAFIAAAVALFFRAHWKGREQVNTENPVAEPPATTAMAAPVPAPSLIPASFADVAKSLEPVVVNISSTQIIHAPRIGPFVMPDRKSESLGSGFVIDPEGYILTNNHVVAESSEIIVQFTNGKEYRATIVGTDAPTDLALIKIDNPDRKFASAALGDSEALRVGDWVVAVGNPFGLGGTVTAGIVSAKSRIFRQSRYDDFIQTDASINPGNSGGPLVNLRGEVVGINSSIFSPTGGNIGIGFAIPINIAKSIIPQLKTQGKVVRAWIGVILEEVTPDLAESFGLNDAHGALIVQVYPNGPAGKAGIKEGDIITKIGDNDISDYHELARVVSLSNPGAAINVTLLREGKQMQITVILEPLPTQRELASLSADLAGQGEATSEMMGVTVRSLPPDTARKMGLSGGVVITDVVPGSPAHRGGLAPGDVIAKINGQAPRGADGFMAVASKLERGRVVRLLVLRNGASHFLTLRIP